MRLSEEQESFIAAEVDTHQLKIKTLKDDLFDHLCCAVEAKIQEGASFEEAFQGSLTELDPDGLFELEKETIFLINKNRIIMMKRIQYFIGFIGAFSLSVGATFKFMQWPGATLMLTVGVLLLLCVFIPLYAAEKYKYTAPKDKLGRVGSVLGGVSSLLVGFSIVFKLMHLMGADILFIIGSAVFALGFLPLYFINMYGKSLKLKERSAPQM